MVVISEHCLLLAAAACPKACRALLQVERQKSFATAQQELQSLTARYRGPLLEACVDLENRLWHLANATSEWKNAEGGSMISKWGSKHLVHWMRNSNFADPRGGLKLGSCTCLWQEVAYGASMNLSHDSLVILEVLRQDCVAFRPVAFCQNKRRRPTLGKGKCCKVRNEQ